MVFAAVQIYLPQQLTVLKLSLDPPSQKTMGVSLWMNATVGPSEARRAKEGASADSAEERKDTTGVNAWSLHEKDDPDR